MKNPYVESRAENIEHLEKIIEREKSVKHKRLLGLMGLRGLTEKTIVSYIKVLEESGHIEYDGKTESWKIKK